MESDFGSSPTKVATAFLNPCFKIPEIYRTTNKSYLIFYLVEKNPYSAGIIHKGSELVWSGDSHVTGTVT